MLHQSGPLTPASTWEGKSCGLRGQGPQAAEPAAVAQSLPDPWGTVGRGSDLGPEGLVRSTRVASPQAESHSGRLSRAYPEHYVLSSRGPSRALLLFSLTSLVFFSLPLPYSHLSEATGPQGGKVARGGWVQLGLTPSSWGLPLLPLPTKIPSRWFRLQPGSSG